MVAVPDVPSYPEKTLAAADDMVHETVWPRYGTAGAAEVSIAQP